MQAPGSRPSGDADTALAPESMQIALRRRLRLAFAVGSAHLRGPIHSMDVDMGADDLGDHALACRGAAFFGALRSWNGPGAVSREKLWAPGGISCPNNGLCKSITT